MDTTGITPYDTQQRKIFKKLLDVADIDKLSRKERLQYEANLKSFRDYNSTMDYAVKVSREKGLRKGIREGIQKGREVGIKEGREVGIKEGMYKGLQKGREVGLAEGREEERRQLAIKLKTEGLPNDFISRLTGLTTEEVERL